MNKFSCNVFSVVDSGRNDIEITINDHTPKIISPCWTNYSDRVPPLCRNISSEDATIHTKMVLKFYSDMNFVLASNRSSRFDIN